MSKLYVTEETFPLLRKGDEVIVRLKIGDPVGGSVMAVGANGDRLVLTFADVEYVDRTVIVRGSIVQYGTAEHKPDYRPYWGRVRAFDDHFVWIDRYGDETKRDSVRRSDVGRKLEGKVGTVSAVEAMVEEVDPINAPDYVQPQGKGDPLREARQIGEDVPANVFDDGPTAA